MSAGHTRGPWSVEVQHEDNAEGEVLEVYVCHEDTVCDYTVVATMGRSSAVPHERRLADARLIAAAPSLLAAVQELLIAHDTNAPAFCLDNLRVAVAKATGAPNPLPNPDNQMPGGRVK